MSRFAPNAKSCFAMRMPGWTAALWGEKESMQAMQRTLLQTCHAGTDETSNAFLRSPNADLCTLGSNQASVWISRHREEYYYYNCIITL